MADILPWLPKTAFTEALLQKVLRPFVSSWSSNWFAGNAVEIISIQPIEGRTICPADHLKIAGRMAEIRVSGRSRRVLLEAALSIRLDKLEIGEADHRLLNAFMEAVAEDLADRIAALAGDGEIAPLDADLLIVLGLDGEKLIELRCASFHLVDAVKAAVAKASKGGALVPRLSALGPSRVVAEGFLGRARIGAEDLEGLGVGDVLILDHLVDDPVGLRLFPGMDLIARGTLDQDGERISIQISEARV